MLARCLSVSLCATLILGLAGCGGGAAVPVSGKVSLTDGTPLKNGSVTYHPDSTKGNTSKELSVGQIDESGNYSLVTGAKKGTPAGWYKVTVTSSVPSDPKNEYSLPKSLIAEKFTKPESTDLNVEVKSGAAAGTYDLKVSK